MDWGDQVLEVTAIQGQIINRLIADGPAQRGAGGFHLRNFCSNGDRLGLLAGLQRKVDANVFANLHQHAGVLDRLEALRPPHALYTCSAAGWRRDIVPRCR